MDPGRNEICDLKEIILNESVDTDIQVCNISGIKKIYIC